MRNKDYSLYTTDAVKKKNYRVPEEILIVRLQHFLRA